VLAFTRIGVYVVSIMSRSATKPAEFADEQRVLVQALRDPACYPHPVASVALIETHISYVLLTGRYAYKIKKAVDFGFLDFSSLAKRRRCCVDELRLNRRLAPQLYLAVVPIGGAAREPRVGDEVDDSGARTTAIETIEYAVKMVEFPQSALLDGRLARGELSVQQIDALVDVVAAFHAQLASARPAGDDSGFGAPASIWRMAADNFALLAGSGDTAEAARLARLESWSRDEYARLTGWLAERRCAGFVRECHGDLHLGNIALIDGQPVVFDCIEFNAQLRWIDVVSEVAFLCMDLAERGRADFAQRLLNRYLEAGGDYAGLRGLPFYLVYRALVRAKVASLRAAQQASAPARRQREISAQYVAFAERASLPRARQLLLMHGVSGSGKSWVSQALVERLGALRLRSDVERKRLCGLPALARSASAVDCGLYDEDMTRATYRELACRAREVLAAGFPVLIDAACLQRWQRETFYEVAAQQHVPWRIVSCRADEATLRRRIVAREQAGGDASEADLAILAHQQRHNDPLSSAELDAAIVFDGERDSLEQLLARCALKTT
jgi:aminoglycoside phosphotransferase family enzyme/predicted kinase